MVADPGRWSWSLVLALALALALVADPGLVAGPGRWTWSLDLVLALALVPDQRPTEHPKTPQIHLARYLLANPKEKAHHGIT